MRLCCSETRLLPSVLQIMANTSWPTLFSSTFNLDAVFIICRDNARWPPLQPGLSVYINESLRFVVYPVSSGIDASEPPEISLVTDACSNHHAIDSL